MNKLVNAARRILIFNDLVNILLMASILIGFFIHLSPVVFIVLCIAYLVSTVASFVRLFDKELVAIGKKRGSKFWRIAKIIGTSLVNIASIAGITLLMLLKLHLFTAPFWPIAALLSISFGIGILTSGVLGICNLCCKDGTIDNKLIRVIVLTIAIGACLTAIWDMPVGEIMLFVSGVCFVLLAIFTVAKHGIHGQEVREFDINSDENEEETDGKRSIFQFETPQKASLFGKTERNQEALKIVSKKLFQDDDDGDETDKLLDGDLLEGEKDGEVNSEEKKFV